MNEIDPLVGRDRELALLERLLDEARAGAARFVVVTGEPGIGKTRLLSELVSRAERHGCLALAGSAAEFERDFPFGPVIDALDAYLESLDAHAVDRLAADGLEDLAAVFPSLRSLRSRLERPPLAAERFRAYRAVRELLERLAARQPLVLTLDDLHWADGASLELVAHLLRRPPEAPIMLAGSFRTGQADAAVTAAIDLAAHGDQVERLEVGPLARADAEELVGVVDQAQLERMYLESGGNPFYLLQLARMDGDGSATTDETPGAGGEAPLAVASAIERELGGLSASARLFAEAAAVAGDPFELDLAAAAADVEESDALAALDELTRRDLIRPAEVPRMFNFRHPLLRSAIYQSCLAGARLAAHARSAEALAARGAPAVSRAHHVEQSARHGDRAAIAILLEAGKASAHTAPRSATRWFEAALRLLPENAASEERIELLMALAGALAATGRFADAHERLLECITADAGESGDLQVRLATACAGVEQLLGHHERAHARLLATLEALPDSGSPQGVALMLALATDAFYRGESEAMREWGGRALKASTELADPTLTAAAAAVLTLGCSFTGAIAEAETHHAEATALVDAMPDEELVRRLDAVGNLAGAELYLEHFEAAAAHAGRGLALARATGQGELFPIFFPALGTATWVLGRLAESAELLDGAVEAARLTGNVQALAWSLLNRSFAALMAGDLQSAIATGEESVDLAARLDDGLVCALAGTALAAAVFEDGDPARAAELLVSAGGGEELPRLPGGLQVNHLEILTRCWLALGRPDDAARAAARAEARAETLGLPRSAAMAHRAAAAVALHAGDPGTAAERALAAAAAAEEVGARVDAAVARILAGRALAEAGDTARGVAELERAAAAFGAFGATRYRDQAEHELRKLGRRIHRRTRPGAAHGEGIRSLSGRELEIARLVVDRRTNPEIAASLFLSRKTVETHMHNIFHKLGVSSRVEVARVMERTRGA